MLEVWRSPSNSTIGICVPTQRVAVDLQNFTRSVLLLIRKPQSVIDLSHHLAKMFNSTPDPFYRRDSCEASIKYISVYI